MDSRNGLLGSEPGFATHPQSPYSPQQSDFDQSYPQSPYPPQPTYTPNPYADNAMEHAYDQGYAGREGLAPSTPSTSAHRPKFSFLKSKWLACFMGVTGLQAIICLICESYVFGRFQSSLGPHIDLDDVQSQYKTIPTFLTLFIFGFIYECVVVWDALRMTNTIQVIGVCIANLALMVYTTTQVDQIAEALDVLQRFNALEPGTTSEIVWVDVRPFLIAIPVVIAVGTFAMAFLTWKLYQQFAWDILKNIGADYRMKKRFLHYQIYIALLKFDFFFFLGFIIQFVVVVARTDDPEFALTIVTIPITILILLAAAYSTKHENKTGMIAVTILYFGGLSYFIFKLVRIYQPGFKEHYEAVQKSLTAFAVITILLIILTIINGIICLRNFGAGLKGHLQAMKSSDEKPDAHSLSLHDVKPQQPSRMTIE